MVAMLNANSLPEPLASKRVLIIGSGKVGGQLLHLLPQAKATTTSLAKAEKSGGRLIALNALDLEAVQRVMAEEQPEVVVMAMAPSKVLTNELYRRFFVDSIINIAAALDGTQQLIYLGSSALYGNHRGAVVTEDSQPLAKFNRGVTQGLAQVIATYHSKTTVLRIGGLYSEQYGVLGHKDFLGPCDEEAGRVMNFTHIEDAARAVVFAIEQPEKMLGVFNLANVGVRASELMTLVTHWTGETRDWTESNFTLSSARIISKGFSPKHRELY